MTRQARKRFRRVVVVESDSRRVNRSLNTDPTPPLIPPTFSLTLAPLQSLEARHQSMVNNTTVRSTADNLKHLLLNFQVVCNASENIISSRAKKRLHFQIIHIIAAFYHVEKHTAKLTVYLSNAALNSSTTPIYPSIHAVLPTCKSFTTREAPRSLLPQTQGWTLFTPERGGLAPIQCPQVAGECFHPLIYRQSLR